MFDLSICCVVNSPLHKISLFLQSDENLSVVFEGSEELQRAIIWLNSVRNADCCLFIAPASQEITLSCWIFLLCRAAEGKSRVLYSHTHVYTHSIITHVHIHILNHHTPTRPHTHTHTQGRPLLHFRCRLIKTDSASFSIQPVRRHAYHSSLDNHRERWRVPSLNQCALWLC